MKANKAKKIAQAVTVAMTLAGLGAVASPAAAEGFSSTDVQLLYGNNFNKDFVTGNDTTDGHMRTITLEHFGTWEKGDNFFFFDLTNGKFIDGNTEHFYGEWHPRVSLSKITGHKFSFGPVKDTYLAGEINWGDTPTYDPTNGFTANSDHRNFHADLEGIGFDLAVPGFENVGLNLYSRKDNFDKRRWQVSPFWGTHFNLGAARFEFSGFVDIAGMDNGTDIMAQPQILLDVGKLAGTPKDRILAGVEWYWHKNPAFGRNSAPQAMVKWYW